MSLSILETQISDQIENRTRRSVRMLSILNIKTGLRKIVLEIN